MSTTALTLIGALVVVVVLGGLTIALLEAHLLRLTRLIETDRAAHRGEVRELLLHLRDPASAIGYSYQLAEQVAEPEQGGVEVPPAPNAKLWRSEADEIDEQLTAAQAIEQLAMRGVQ